MHWYEAATIFCRVHDGLSNWMDRYRSSRLKALGNSICPQVAAEIMKAIKRADEGIGS
jgi:hypothetical protein